MELGFFTSETDVHATLDLAPRNTVQLPRSNDTGRSQPRAEKDPHHLIRIMPAEGCQPLPTAIFRRGILFPSAKHAHDMKDKAADVLEAIRTQRPLVHCLTNGVVKNFTANSLLALGAAPAMVEDPSEASEFAAMANALLVNVGTLDEPQIRAMRAAVDTANFTGKPWVLDPVAVGPITLRTHFAREIAPKSPAIIRGNASEIIALSGQQSQVRGTDSGDRSETALDAARSLIRDGARSALITGPIDFATDGESQIACRNGHELLTRVTGVGCAQGAIAAACAACSEDPLVAATAAALIVAVAGEIAAETTQRPGSFQIAFLDALDALEPETLNARAKLS